jgi:hypothetical protein
MSITKWRNLDSTQLKDLHRCGAGLGDIHDPRVYVAIYANNQGRYQNYGFLQGPAFYAATDWWSQETGYGQNTK